MIKFGEIFLKILILLAVSFVSFIVGGIVTALLIDLINWEFITTPSILSDPSFWKIGLIVAPFTIIMGRNPTTLVVGVRQSISKLFNKILYI